MEELKEFIVFGGSHFTPNGGWSDFIGFFSTLSEATEACNSYANSGEGPRWSHVVSIAEGKIVYRRQW